MTKRTWNPKQKKRARKHGFLHRAKKHLGVLKSRRAKGRKRLTDNAK